VSDLAWLRERGLADALTARTGPILAICGGYQMLGKQILDDVESGQGVVAGLGLLDLDIEFAPEKVLCQTEGTASELPVQGYEIHHGRVRRSGDLAWFAGAGGPEGSVRGNIRGTHWHGLLANDDFRRAYVTEVAISAGRRGFQVAPDTSVESVRETALDAIADLLEENVQVDELLALAQTSSYRADPIVRHSLET
ncbi:MAG: cobyric acid synthase CobQ, partial [Nocardiaceae bacterium]|nr:cobyric acid synthase CobQ [Nocardiaceae bacterium]